jgi:dTDP-4-dehydrorhamnose reductase
MITPLVGGRGRSFQQEVVAALRRAGFEMPSVDLDELDLDDRRACRRVIARSRADIVIDCTGADDVGRGPALPRPDELKACENLAIAAAEEGAHTVLVSSASVFEGESGGPRLESDPPSPHTLATSALAAAERAVARANPDHTIVRSARLYGPMWNSPFDEVIARARLSDPLVVEPRSISPPTYGPHLASVLVSLVRKPCHGIIHRVAGGTCDELDLIRTVLRAAELTYSVEAEPAAPARDGTSQTVTLASCRDELPALPHWRIGLRACALERNRMVSQEYARRAPAR